VKNGKDSKNPLSDEETGVQTARGSFPPEIKTPREVLNEIMHARGEERSSQADRERKNAKKARRHEEKQATRQHQHEKDLEQLRARHAEETEARDQKFALTLIGALLPLVHSIGSGILAMQQISLKAQNDRLNAEVLIAEKSPEYAAERAKLHAASGRMFMDR
jgi:hypothetical protein